MPRNLGKKDLYLLFTRECAEMGDESANKFFLREAIRSWIVSLAAYSLMRSKYVYGCSEKGMRGEFDQKSIEFLEQALDMQGFYTGGVSLSDNDIPTDIHTLLWAFASSGPSELILEAEIELLREIAARNHFVWPDALAKLLKQKSARKDVVRNVNSPLSLAGYKVGRSGKSAKRRRQILKEIFEGPLHHETPSDFVSKWGNANSIDRLKGISGHLANLARTQQARSDPAYEKAISDWQDDLEWLRRTFYEGRFSFPWPG